MAHQFDLSARYQNILKATIDRYIATAEPVASKTLAQEYDFNVSSATIRNIMGRLEAAGLLYQPHVSAGRVPSDFGYRTYVDRLIIRDRQTNMAIEQALREKLRTAQASFETLLQQAAKILATLSGYIALITFPQNSNSILRHLQLVRIANNQVMLIVVTDAYQTQSIVVESPLAVDEVDETTLDRQLQQLSNFLDRQLTGRSLVEIMASDWTQIDHELAGYSDFIQSLLNRLSQALNNSPSPILIHGVAEFLRQPEFTQLQQVQTLLSLLEEDQEKLLPAIFSFADADSLRKVRVKIGTENHLEPMRTCTLVCANYYQDDVALGSVGVLGPKRMLYENAIALVENTANYLSNPFQDQ